MNVSNVIYNRERKKFKSVICLFVSSTVKDIFAS
jgi:hypothetical protein